MGLAYASLRGLHQHHGLPAGHGTSGAQVACTRLAVGDMIGQGERRESLSRNPDSTPSPGVRYQ